MTDRAFGRLLVTGGAGFIGSNLVDRLLALNPALRLRMGERARVRSLDMGLWENKIERLVDIYEDVAARAANPVIAREAHVELSSDAAA